jgi:hypothetical protein
MTDSADLISPDGRQQPYQDQQRYQDRQPYQEPIVRTLSAHLAGIERPDTGPATLWLSDEATTMHFPLTAATVPALLSQLDTLARDYGPQVVTDDDLDYDPADEPEFDPEFEQPEDEPQPGRLARWTGWHYSNTLVSRLPPQQRIALFAAVLVVLVLITLFTRG